MKQEERISRRIFFFSDGFVPPVLLMFLGALNLCKAIMVCMGSVLSKAPSQPAPERMKKVLYFKFDFRMYFFNQHSSSASALPSLAAAVLK